MCPKATDTCCEASGTHEEHELNDSDKRLLRFQITGDGEESSDALLDEFEEDFGDVYAGDCLAVGTWVGAGPQVFDVIIHYRDPRSSHLAEPRSWSLEVSALSRRDARRTATQDFRLVESLSSEHWQHEILAIEVIGDDPIELGNAERSRYLS